MLPASIPIGKNKPDGRGAKDVALIIVKDVFVED
jgi:hypothetical protein